MDITVPAKVQDLDMAFGPKNINEFMPSWEVIPEEYKRSSNKWSRIVNQWFFNGLRNGVFTAKEGVDTNDAIRHLKTIMSSWTPKHEHKTAAVAYLMDKWFEDVTYDN